VIRVSYCEIILNISFKLLRSKKNTITAFLFHHFSDPPPRRMIFFCFLKSLFLKICKIYINKNCLVIPRFVFKQDILPKKTLKSEFWWHFGEPPLMPRIICNEHINDLLFYLFLLLTSEKESPAVNFINVFRAHFSYESSFKARL